MLNQTEAEPAKPEDKPASKPEDYHGAPDAYEPFKLPDGWELADDSKTEVEGMFRKLGLNQAAGQELLDFYTKASLEAMNAPFEAFKALNEQWVTEAQNHPDLRGKLGPGKEVSVRIGKLLDGLGDAGLTQEFRTVMDLTGAGNHPAFIRVLDRFAQRLTEGTHVAGSKPSAHGQSAAGQAGPASAAQAMYPHLPSGSR